MPLDALDPTFINAPGGVGPTYDAEELRRDLGFLLTGGATAGVSRTGVLDPRALTVTLSGSNLQINPGGAAIGTGKGAYLTGSAATATIAALGSAEWPVADATNPRRDRIVLEVLDPDNGGGAGRKAQFRVIAGTPSATAASGGGYAPAPSSPSITLAYVDVPKAGNGAPVVTDQRPRTSAAGGPVLVRDQAEADALPKWDGATRRLLYLPSRPLEVCDGVTWWRASGRYREAYGAGAIGVVAAGALQGPYAQAFPAGSDFTVPPLVFPTTNQSRVMASADNITKTGFDLYLQNVTTGNSANGVYRYEAVQMTPTSATG